jgi:hypothetical protein
MREARGTAEQLAVQQHSNAAVAAEAARNALDHHGVAVRGHVPEVVVQQGRRVEQRLHCCAVAGGDLRVVCRGDCTHAGRARRPCRDGVLGTTGGQAAAHGHSCRRCVCVCVERRGGGGGRKGPPTTVASRRADEGPRQWTDSGSHFAELNASPTTDHSVDAVVEARVCVCREGLGGEGDGFRH